MITIKVCGPPQSGKTTIAKLIQEALQARGIFPHLSNKTAVNWDYLEVAQQLESRIVTIDEQDEDQGPSDDELCRETVKRILAEGFETEWADVEHELGKVGKDYGLCLGHTKFLELAARICESLAILGFKSTKPKI